MILNNKYKFPVIDMNGKEIVRLFSIVNPWMDVLVIVDKDYKTQTEQLVEQAMNDYWDYYYECYGDAIESYLNDAGIKYEIIFHDSEDMSDEYENAWENFMDVLYSQKNK